MSHEQRLHARCGCGFTHLSSIASTSHEAESAEKGGARPFAFAGTPRHYERDRPFSIEHVALDGALDLEKKQIRARAELTVTRVDPAATWIALDAVGFELERVESAGKPLPYEYDGKTLRVDLGASDRATLAVSYSATPRRGLYFLEPDPLVVDRPKQVWSQCQEEDARHFIPLHDKPHVKFTFEVKLAVPNGFSLLSNGALVSKITPAEGPWTFHFRMDDPLPSYLLTLVCGEFSEYEEEVAVAEPGGRHRASIPLTYLYPKGRDADARRTFARTAPMMELLGKLTGVPYPWNKYAQVVVSDFIFGGMENTTATTMYEHILLDEKAAVDISSDDLVVHELAHQWFGDFVTCRDWSEGWLNEGFATFSEQVWREHHEGKDEFEYAVRSDLESYVSEAHGRYRRPIVCQDYDSPLDLFDRHLYEKGGLVLHLLKLELGDALFWKGVHLYLTRHARGVVETRDLQRALEEVSGRGLGRLFDQWVYKAGHPELDVELKWEPAPRMGDARDRGDPSHARKGGGGAGILTVVTKQTQSSEGGVPSVFEVPLVLSIHHKDGRVREERLAASERSQTFAIPLPERPAFVVVDPSMRILGEVTVKAPGDLLRAQLAGAPTARGRWLAAHALGRDNDAPTLGALAERLADENEFWGVRADCAAVLGQSKAKDAEVALRGALATKHPKVRRAAVRALGAFRTTTALEALKPLALADASYLVEAEAARALGQTRQGAAYDVLVDVLDKPSWADVRRVGAIDGLVALRDERAVPHLQARTRYGQPTRARRAAIVTLPRLASDRKTRELLEDLLDDADPHLRIDVVRALVDLGDVKSRGALRARLATDLDPRVRRRLREGLRDIGGESKRVVDQLKEDLEKLLAEHGDLKARLTQLEAARKGEASQAGDARAPSARKKPKGRADAKRAARPGNAAKTGKTPRARGR